jgi:hypothetical protein
MVFSRQLAHLIRHHGKATSGVSGSCGLNGGIQRQQIRLVGNVRNHVQNLANAGDLPIQFVKTLTHGLGTLLHATDGHNDLTNNACALLRLGTALVRTQ